MTGTVTVSGLAPEFSIFPEIEFLLFGDAGLAPYFAFGPWPIFSVRIFFEFFWPT